MSIMNYDKKNIFILLAAFNGATYIRKQLKTILNQTFKPFKILINIDQSRDMTESIVQDFAKIYPEIQTLNSNKRFGSAASNFIHLLKNTDLTEAEYFAMADQDDLWKEDKLEKAIQKLQQGYEGYSSNVEAFWDDGQKKNYNQKSATARI